MNQDDDTLAMADTQFSNQELLSEEEQSAQLNHSSMAHFKIIDILGKGGMGTVYKAKDLALERFVAIKMIRISNSQQPLMLAEAKTISKLNHPNIVTIYDIARDDDANFIVMEWIDASPLNTVIPSQGLPLNKVLVYAKQMVAALACAHQQNIIHRDIKPQNIMVDGDGRIKILDFGIAALIDAEKPLGEANDTAKSAIVMGSPQYMAPEQVKGLASDARSDLFSLGIVLYEMLTGVKPFLGLNFKQITQAITQGEYTSITDVQGEYSRGNRGEQKTEIPTEIIAIIDKLLQIEPAKRYQTAEELAQDIDVIDAKINHNKNWWQQQHWLTKILFVIPIIAMLGWSINSILFPPSTQDLIARQLLESKKIAFLPFDNISGDPVLQIFSDGVATMLSSDLAEVGYQQGDGTTWVLPTSEIRHLEDPSVAGIYNEYGVDVIVTGSIQHMGSTRSLHLSLINGADGRQLKSVELSLDAENLFAAQTQIRQQVLELLGWKIPVELIAKFAQKKPAFDGAYKHYLAGQGYLYRFDHNDNIDKAVEAFKSAIAIDPYYADAYAGLAEAQLQKFNIANDIILLMPTESTVLQLKKIDSSHHLLSYLQAELKFYQGEYVNAVELFEQSIRLRPSFLKAYIGLSDSYQQLGELIKAEQALLESYALMPNNNLVLTQLGVFHYKNGDYLRAIEYFDLLANQTPNNYIAYLNISACYYLIGDVKKAILVAEKSLNIQPNYIAYSNIGTYYFILRDYDKAVESFEEMITLHDTDYVNWGNLADAYRFSNNKKYIESFKQAISLAEQVIDVNQNNKTAIASLAYYYANIGNVEKTLFYAKKVSENDLGEDQFIIAAAYVRIQMNQLALEYLAFAMNNNYSLAEITSSPLLDGLKNAPKYLELINQKIE